MFAAAIGRVASEDVHLVHHGLLSSSAHRTTGGVEEGERAAGQGALEGVQEVPARAEEEAVRNESDRTGSHSVQGRQGEHLPVAAVDGHPQTQETAPELDLQQQRPGADLRVDGPERQTGALRAAGEERRTAGDDRGALTLLHPGQLPEERNRRRAFNHPRD